MVFTVDKMDRNIEYDLGVVSLKLAESNQRIERIQSEFINNFGFSDFISISTYLHPYTSFTSKKERADQCASLLSKIKELKQHVLIIVSLNEYRKKYHINVEDIEECKNKIRDYEEALRKIRMIESNDFVSLCCKYEEQCFRQMICTYQFNLLKSLKHFESQRKRYEKYAADFSISYTPATISFSDVFIKVNKYHIHQLMKGHWRCCMCMEKNYYNITEVDVVSKCRNNHEFIWRYKPDEYYFSFDKVNIDMYYPDELCEDDWPSHNA